MLSENTEDTGSFFGKIDGTIMDSLVQDRIYRRVALMDYQGACSDSGDSSIAAGENVRPTLLAWLREFIVVISMSWLSMLPGATYAWPQRYTDYEDQDVADLDDYVPENYDMNEDYHSNDVVTVPEIVSTAIRGGHFKAFTELSPFPSSFRSLIDPRISPQRTHRRSQSHHPHTQDPESRPT